MLYSILPQFLVQEIEGFNNVHNADVERLRVVSAPISSDLSE